MTSTITPLITGNWKMNGLRAALTETDRLAALLAAGRQPACEVAICPPATLLAAMSARLAGTPIATGGQDCHPAAGGAHTGDLSAPMLADAGASFVIVGHSERRADHGETDELVNAKAQAGLGAGLVPIICVGETRPEREAGEAETVVARQLAGSVPDAADEAEFVIAYEPVWAIGTGLTPSNADIAAMHGAIRRLLTARFGERGASVRILYGGSLKPGNAKEILAVPDVNGGLIGGASLLSSDLYAIISALE
ncbi:MAG: triose-phosphate isomerase [Devosia sp.]|nr:triose-phosphate isomerase [Devosia sp.]